MLLTKSSTTNLRNKTLLVIAAIFIVTFFVNQPIQASNSNTTISTQICHDAQRAPQIVSTNPANGGSVSNSSTNLAITTNWGNHLTVSLNGTQVFNQAVSYQSGVVTSVPLTNLLADPQTNNLSITLRGGCPEQTISQTITIRYDSSVLSLSQLATRTRSPALSGLVNNPTALVRVTINGQTYNATNNGDGTWTLPAGVIAPELSDGEYSVRVESIDPVTNAVLQTRDYSQGLVIDNVAPNIIFTILSTYDQRSPEFHGTINDPTASIVVTINGQTYNTTNNGDGTWTLPAGVIAQLANGTYDVEVVATDRAGNQSRLNHSIIINANNQLGFVLLPNTGYLRIGKINIPSWFLYLIAIITIYSIYKLSAKKTSKTK